MGVAGNTQRCSGANWPAEAGDAVFPVISDCVEPGAGGGLGLFGMGVLTRAGPMAFDLKLLMGALACLLVTTCYGFAGFLARR